MNLSNRIFEIENDQDFLDCALELFSYQKKHCSIYGEFVEYLNWPEPTKLKQIPFLPISFFKTHKVVDSSQNSQLLFKSSGTGGNRSKHFVSSPQLYQKSFNSAYRKIVGDPNNQVILALLPNYLEQGESSLVYMVDHLIKRSKNELSGFFLNNTDDLITNYKEAAKNQANIIIFGVSYALLDLAEENVDLSKATIIETGGMKGRREEMTKKDLHTKLRNGLNNPEIRSEYGMTELLSQAYSKEEWFECPPWMKLLIRDTNDPFTYSPNGKTGGINIIDLANIHSCSFIASQDLGRILNNRFQIMGRFDNSDIRGCNLMVQ